KAAEKAAMQDAILLVQAREKAGAEARAKIMADAKAKANAAALKSNQAAAAKGDMFGLLRMGERYRDGDGVQKDLSTARDYLQRAAEAGSPTAKDELSKLPAP
ncbi:MAG: SEL1-like repeat protein, partial [Verrucomicrobiota bacterium]